MTKAVLAFLLCVVLATSAYAKTSVISISVVDATTGELLPARCQVIDSTAADCYPGTMESAVYHTAQAAGTMPYAMHWYTATGTADVTVEDGATIIGASHGPEYNAFHDTITVSANAAIECALTPVEDMNALGWYSFDGHTHIRHSPNDYFINPTTARQLAECENLDILNCLDPSWFFSGAVDTYSTSSTLVFMAEEMRHRKWGHMELPGVSALVESVSYKHFWSPMLFQHADATHAAGGLFIPAHTNSQGNLTTYDGNEQAKEIPLMLWRDNIDALNVMSLSSRSTGGRDLAFWYEALEAGFEINPSVGTDAVANWDTGGKPIAGYRGYVWLGDEALSYQAYMDSLPGGSTFVTSGPLFKWFKIEDKFAGGAINRSAYRPTTVNGRFIVECSTAPLRASVIVNGEVDQNFFFSGETELDQEFAVSVNEPAWVAVQVMGETADWSTVGDSLFAHTGPIYIKMAGIPRIDTGACDFWSDWCDTLTAEATAHGVWPEPADGTAALATIDSCNTWFEARFAARGVYTVGTGGDFANLVDGVAGTAAGDTLVLLPGKHTTTNLTIDDRTICGPSQNADDATIINTSATQQVLKVTSGATFIRNLTLRVTGVDMTGAGGFFIYQTGGDLICNNVRWANVTGTGANVNDVCLYVTTAATSTRLFSCVVDSCSNPMANEENLMLIADPDVAVVRDCIFSNNISGDPALWLWNTVAQDTTIVTGSLFVNNRTIQEGGALRWSPAASTHKEVSYCTFYGNECNDVSDAQFYSDDAANKTLSYSIFAEGDSTYAILGNWASIEHCNAFGNVQDYFAPSGTGLDTLHVDSQFNSTVAPIAPNYAAKAKGCRDSADGLYMGWLHWEPATGSPAADHRRRR